MNCLCCSCCCCQRCRRFRVNPPRCCPLWATRQLASHNHNRHSPARQSVVARQISPGTNTWLERELIAQQDLDWKNLRLTWSHNAQCTAATIPANAPQSTDPLLSPPASPYQAANCIRIGIDIWQSQCSREINCIKLARRIGSAFQNVAFHHFPMHFSSVFPSEWLAHPVVGSM